MLKQFADNRSSHSLSHSFRQRRFAYFLKLLSTLQHPLSILDIGGTEEFWNMMGFDEPEIHITLLNIEPRQVTRENFSSIVGDACQLPYEDKSFDVVFSNSVIEHLFTFDNQERMAKEVERVGKHYFIQTPNYYFPMEPHWLFPCFQFLPFSLRLLLTRNFRLGHIGRIPDKQKAISQVKEVRLLTAREFVGMFSNPHLYREKAFLLTKSLVVHNFATSTC